MTRTAVPPALADAMTRLNNRHPWSHNDHFHGWIVRTLPGRPRRVLDVGCGEGGLVAILAAHADEVIGVDADAGMRERAARRCAELPNVSIAGGDWTCLEGEFDAITMIAVLHHLDIDRALSDVRRMLAPGGRFLTVGLAPPRGIRDRLWDLASAVTNPLVGLAKHPRVNRAAPAEPPFPVRDPTVPFDELRRMLAETMPGARMRHRLAFRHTIRWTKP